MNGEEGRKERVAKSNLTLTRKLPSPEDDRQEERRKKRDNRSIGRRERDENRQAGCFINSAF